MSEKTDTLGGLTIFDIDDTLFKTTARVVVRKGKKLVKRLETGGYSKYRLKPGESFDFRDFDKKLQNPRVIKQNIELLKKQLDKARRSSRGARKVTILTARRLGQPVTSFLKTMGIDAYVVPLGSADPQKKADWIEDQIRKGYDTVYFMDDSNKNVAAVKNMLKRYPRVKSITKLIKEGLLTEGIVPALELDQIDTEIKKIVPNNRANVTIFKWPNYIKLISHVESKIDKKYHKKFNDMMKKNGWVGM